MPKQRKQKIGRGARSGSKKNSITAHLQFTSAQSVAARGAVPDVGDLPQEDSEDEATSGGRRASNLERALWRRDMKLKDLHNKI